jgi:excisionase family DNA binding protein
MPHSSDETDRICNPPLLMTVGEVASETRLGTRTVWRLVSKGAFPAPIALGGATRWRRQEIEDFLRSKSPE